MPSRNNELDRYPQLPTRTYLCQLLPLLSVQTLIWNTSLQIRPFERKPVRLIPGLRRPRICYSGRGIRAEYSGFFEKHRFAGQKDLESAGWDHAEYRLCFPSPTSN